MALRLIALIWFKKTWYKRMQLLFTTDLAIKALTYMAVNNKSVATFMELGKEFDVVPTAFKRPFRVLIDKGIVSSVQGRNGGLKLQRDPAKIYLGELIALLESDMHVVPLLKPNESGAPNHPDSVYRFTAVHATLAFLSKWDGVTIADLAADPHTRSAFGIRSR